MAEIDKIKHVALAIFGPSYTVASLRRRLYMQGQAERGIKALKEYEELTPVENTQDKRQGELNIKECE